MVFDPARKNRFEYDPDPLGRLGQGTWREVGAPSAEDLVPDNDAEVAAMRRAFVRGEAMPVLRGGGLHVENGLGRDRANARADVARVEVALARAGHYDLNGTGGPTGWWGTPQEEALRAFQTQNGLKPTGTFDAGDETHAALSRALAANDDGGSGIRIGANDNGAGEGGSGGDGGAGAPLPRPRLSPSIAPLLGAAAAMSGSELSLLTPVLTAGALLAAGSDPQNREALRQGSQWLGQAASQGANAAGRAVLEGAAALSAMQKAGPDPVRTEFKLPPGALRNPTTQEAFTPSPPVMPNHTGNQTPPPQLPVTSGGSAPAPNLPNSTGAPPPKVENGPLINVPPHVDPKEWIEIFPNQADELDQHMVVEANPGKPPTRIRNTAYIQIIRDVFGDMVKIYKGGNLDKEHMLPKSDNADGRSFLDVMVKLSNGWSIYINDMAALADRITPTKDEQYQITKVQANREKQSIFMGWVKPKEGEEVDWEKVREILLDLKKRIEDGTISELADKPQFWNVVRKIAR